MIAIYKQKGETPLQSLDRLRKTKTEYADAKLSYAGRLDPMAEGVMLVLIADENKNREEYLGLDKIYVTEILFGIGTDTGDVLGKVVEIKPGKVDMDGMRQRLQKFIGKFPQKYPTYSSKSFAGAYKDVHDGKKEENFHDVEIYSADLLEIRKITSDALLLQIKKDISLVTGDFRQAEIIKSFESISYDISYDMEIAKIRLSVSSGFYVRQFAEDLGTELGTLALAYSIVREKVGEYGIGDCAL